MKIVEENASKNDDASDSPIEEWNITLFSQNNIPENKVVVVESFNSAVIDTACTQTVGGKRWLENYMKTIKAKIKVTKSKKSFRFGDGKVIESFKKVILLSKIGNAKCDIELGVINADIPLLPSKTSLKIAGTILDLNSNKTVMFGSLIDSQFISTGHYCIDITDNSGSEALVVNDNMKESVSIKMITKLHQQERNIGKF